MADTDNEFRKKLAAKFRELRTHQAKEYELTEGIIAMLEGNPTVGDTVRRLMLVWSSKWEVAYKDRYRYIGPMEVNGFKKLLKTTDPDEIERRMAVYLRRSDLFYQKARHGLSVFFKSFNEFGAGQADAKLEAPVVGCQHRPPCGTDQEHTKRRMAEMRT
jgi:hypothetical protein